MLGNLFANPRRLTELIHRESESRFIRRAHQVLSGVLGKVAFENRSGQSMNLQDRGLSLVWPSSDNSQLLCWMDRDSREENRIL